MNGMWVKDKRFFTLPAFAAMVLSICLAADADAEKKPATAPTTGQAEIKPVEPGFETGYFQKISDRIGGLLGLTWKGKTLRLDRDNWGRDLKRKSQAEVLKILEADFRRNNPMKGRWAVQMAQSILRHRTSPSYMAFHRLRAVTGRMESGRTGGILNRRFNTFKSVEMTGRLDISTEGEFRVVLGERKGPGRKIELLDDDNNEIEGTFVLILSGGKGKFSLEIGQSHDGSIHIKHVSGKDVFDAKASCFKVFYARNRQYVDDRLCPLLKHWGILPPITSFSPEAKKEVLNRLHKPPGAGKIARGKELIEQLDDNLFKKRQEATRLLSKNFADYRKLILQAMKQATISPEARSRLKIIIKENADYQPNPIDDFVTDQGLVSDVDYLVGLIGKVPVADRAVVARALQRLTKQKFGPDPDAWRKWWSQKQATK